MVMVNANGWRVEKVVRRFGDRVPVAGLRISWHGYWQADCRTTAEVAEYVDLSTLVPEAPHKYARAAVKAPWQSAEELLDVLARATAQPHELAKTHTAVNGSQPQLGVVPDKHRLLGRPATQALNSSNDQLETPTLTL